MKFCKLDYQNNMRRVFFYRKILLFCFIDIGRQNKGVLISLKKNRNTVMGYAHDSVSYFIICCHNLHHGCCQDGC